MVAETLTELWCRAVERPPSRIAFLVEEGGAWREVGWAEAGSLVDEVAAGLLALGIGAGDRVAILSRTRFEWALCDWALISIGALVVPIYPTSSALECAFLLGNSGARFLVCENAAQHAKVAPTRRELEALEQVIAFEPLGSDAVSLEELRRRGRELLRGRPVAVAEARGRIVADDVLTIVYTSGTIGPPKGCVLTHRNYRAMVDMVLGVRGLVEPGDRTLLFLPLAHTFARLVEFLGPATGLTIAFCPEASAVPGALTEVRPTIFPSVPRLFEKVRAAIESSLDESRGARGRLARWALATGYEASERTCAGRRLPPGLALRHALADRLVLARVRARLGGRLRFAISGGAPLAGDVAEFFHALGILILEGYGLTESTTAATMNRPDAFRFGTVGPALPGVELAIADDGEILVRGENVFSGYYRDDESTGAVLTENGWLRTGDVGALDADGFLTITDRKKDIIVTAAGKNVAPQNLEAALRSSRYVSDALVLGDRRPYLVALIALDREEAGRVAHGEDELHALAAEAVAQANRDRAPFEQVRKFVVLPQDFSAELNELTPTLKVRRHVCEEHFRQQIERLYAGA